MSEGENIICFQNNKEVKIMKKVLKVLSIVLTVVLLIGIFSCATPVFAAEITDKDSIESTLKQYKSQIENSEDKKLYEIPEERDGFTKVF